jgi:hypothetical protein
MARQARFSALFSGSASQPSGAAWRRLFCRVVQKNLTNAAMAGLVGIEPTTGGFKVRCCCH